MQGIDHALQLAPQTAVHLGVTAEREAGEKERRTDKLQAQG